MGSITKNTGNNKLKYLPKYIIRDKFNAIKFYNFPDINRLEFDYKYIKIAESGLTFNACIPDNTIIKIFFKNEIMAMFYNEKFEDYLINKSVNWIFGCVKFYAYEEWYKEWAIRKIIE